MNQSSRNDLPLSQEGLREVDILCEHLECSWKDGNPAAIDTLLDKGRSSINAVLFVELLRVEIEQRCLLGHLPTREEYLQRFPDRADAIRSVFHEMAHFFPQLSTDWIHLPGYKPVEIIGRGGMGVVFKAVENETSRIVAVKVMRAEREESADFHVRFRREAEIAAQLVHPNIVQLLQAGIHHGHRYLLLEYCAGGSLDDRLRAGSMPLELTVQYVEKLARALQVAHQKGIVHRDLKPANVLLTAALEPKLTDFGLACQADTTTRITNSGMALGTPQYMAPEQIRGITSKINDKTDIYALGVILYECFTGDTPFTGETPQQLCEHILNTHPIDPCQKNRELPPGLGTICLKCLEKDQRDRYSSVTELAEELASWQGQKKICSKPMPSWKRLWRWCEQHRLLASSLALAVFLALSASALATLWGTTTRQLDTAVNELERLAATDYVSQVKFASLHNQEHQYGEMFDLLQQCPREYRGWEWNYLVNQCHLKKSLKGHTDVITQVAVSPDGRWLVSASYDGTVRLWPWGHDQPSRVLTEHTEFVRAVIFYPDSQHFASAGDDRTILVWSIDHDQPRVIIRGHSEGIHELAITRDGTLLASAAADNTVRVWNATDGSPISKSHDLGDNVFTVAFNGNASRLIAGGVFPRLIVLDPQTGKQLASWDEPMGSVDSFCWSPDGNFGYSGDRGYRLRKWNTHTGKMEASVPAHGNDINSVCLLHHGSTLASGGDDSVLRLWSTSTLQPTAVYFGHQGDITCVASAQDEQTVVTASDDKTIRIWDTDNVESQVYQDDDKAILRIDLSRDGTQLASGHSDGRIRIRNPDTGQLLSIWNAHEGVASGVCFNSDRSQLATVGSDCTLRIYDTKTGNCRKTVTWNKPTADDPEKTGLDPPRRTRDGVTEVVTSRSPVSFGPDGQTVACGCWNGKVQYRIGQGDFAEFESGHQGAVTSLEFNAQGTLLATGGIDSQVILREWPSRKLRKSVKAHRDYVYSVAFNPEGSAVVSAGADSLVNVLSCASEAAPILFEGHTDNVMSAAFSPDGMRIVSTSWDRTVRVWDAKMGLELIRLSTKSLRPQDVQFSPDGRFLLCGGDGGFLEIWDGQPQPASR